MGALLAATHSSGSGQAGGGNFAGPAPPVPPVVAPDVGGGGIGPTSIAFPEQAIIAAHPSQTPTFLTIRFSSS
jgi:hypothetical protein